MRGASLKLAIGTFILVAPTNFTLPIGKSTAAVNLADWMSPYIVFKEHSQTSNLPIPYVEYQNSDQKGTCHELK